MLRLEERRMGLGCKGVASVGWLHGVIAGSNVEARKIGARYISIVIRKNSIWYSVSSR